MKKYIPNFLTCCNLLCGSLGILYFLGFSGHILTDKLIGPAYFVWAACIFDFLDGFSARLLKAHSPIGKELDSLADIVSFGLLPTFVMHSLLGSSLNLWGYQAEWLPYLAFLIIVCSALRLAIFNVDESQSNSFRGLPTPANALFITALPFLLPFGQYGARYLFSPIALTIVTVVFSLLMVSRVELFALKFKSLKWSANPLQFIFLILSIILVATLKAVAIPFIIIMYILLSLGVKVFSRQTIT